MDKRLFITAPRTCTLAIGEEVPYVRFEYREIDGARWMTVKYFNDKGEARGSLYTGEQYKEMVDGIERFLAFIRETESADA